MIDNGLPDTEDDGVGIDPTPTLRQSDHRGLGLIGMHERAALAGGTLDIESEVGKGTTIFVRVPLTDGGEGQVGTGL